MFKLAVLFWSIVALGAFIQYEAEHGSANAITLRNQLKDITGFDLAAPTTPTETVDLRQRIADKLKSLNGDTQKSGLKVAGNDAASSSDATVDTGAGQINWQEYSAKDKMTDKVEVTAEGDTTIGDFKVQAVASCAPAGIDIALTAFHGSTPEELISRGEGFTPVRLRSGDGPPVETNAIQAFTNQAVMRLTGKTNRQQGDDYDPYKDTQRSMLSPGKASAFLRLRNLLIELKTASGEALVIELNPHDSALQIFSAGCLIE